MLYNHVIQLEGTYEVCINQKIRRDVLSTTYFEALDDLKRNKSGLTIFLTFSLGAIIQCTPAAASTTALL